MSKELLFKLNLQQFAEGDDDGGNPNPTPNPEESLSKGERDKYTSEIARLKRELKAKQTDEEKALEAQREKDEELEGLRSYKRKAELASSLSKNGISSTEADTIAEKILSGDSSAIAEAIGASFKGATSELQKTIDTLKLQGTDVPGVGSNAGKKETTIDDFRTMTLDDRIALKQSNPTLYNSLKNQK